MTAEPTTHLVKVLEVTTKTFSSGEFKSALVYEEEGYWARKFIINIFPDSPIFDVSNGEKLQVKVRPFTRKYQTLIEGQKVDFTECERCHRYHQEPTCSCTARNVSVRIQGTWELVKVIRSERMCKLHFLQYNERLVHVIFKADCPEFVEGNRYNLTGWQMMESRYNVIVINGEE